MVTKSPSYSQPPEEEGRERVLPFGALTVCQALLQNAFLQSLAEPRDNSEVVTFLKGNPKGMGLRMLTAARFQVLALPIHCH